MTKTRKTTYKERLEMWWSGKDSRGYPCDDCGLESPKFTYPDPLDGQEYCFRCFMRNYKEIIEDYD